MGRRRFLVAVGAAGAGAVLSTSRRGEASWGATTAADAASPLDAGAPAKPGKSLKAWKGKRVLDRLRAENPRLTSPLTKATLSVSDLHDPTKVEAELEAVVGRLVSDIKAGQYRVDDVQRVMAQVTSVMDRMVVTQNVGSECTGAGAEGDLCGTDCNGSTGANCGRLCNDRDGDKSNGGLCGGFCNGSAGNGCGYQCSHPSGNACSPAGVATQAAERAFRTYFEALGGTEYLTDLLVLEHRTEIAARIVARTAR